MLSPPLDSPNADAHLYVFGKQNFYDRNQQL